MRLLKIVASAMLILTGIFCFINQGTTFAAMAFPLGIMMLIYGLSGVVTSFLGGKRDDVFCVVFAEALLTFFLSILVLSNQLMTSEEVLIFFGLWSLMAGTLRVTETLTFRRKNPMWRWSIGQGVLCILTGFAAAFSSSSTGLSVAVLVGIIFILQGGNGLMSGIQLPVPNRKKRAEGGE